MYSFDIGGHTTEIMDFDIACDIVYYCSANKRKARNIRFAKYIVMYIVLFLGFFIS